MEAGDERKRGVGGRWRLARQLRFALRQLFALTSAGCRQSVRTKCSSVGPPVAYSPLAWLAPLPLHYSPQPRYPPAAAVAAVLMTRFHGTFSVVFNAINSTLPPLNGSALLPLPTLSLYTQSLSLTLSLSLFLAVPTCSVSFTCVLHPCLAMLAASSLSPSLFLSISLSLSFSAAGSATN